MASASSNCDFYVNNYKHKHDKKCLLKAISIAKRNIDITINILTSVEFNKALIDAHKRGIYVRILCEIEDKGVEVLKSTDFYINKCNVHFVMDSDTIKHKFCIIDGPREYYSRMKKPDMNLNTILIVGRVIWTAEDSIDDFENIAITSLYQLVCKYQKDFDTMWKDYQEHRVNDDKYYHVRLN